MLSKESYFKELDKVNDDKMCRRMVVEINGKEQCTLHISLPTAKPLITTPSDTTLSELTLFNVDVKVGEYKTYTFKEDTLVDLSLRNLNRSPVPELNLPLPDPKLIPEYKKTRTDILGGKMDGQERYIPYVTIFNPVLKTDATIFIDKKHGDMFYITGLGFLLDEKVQSSKTPIVVRGHAIGGRIVPRDYSDLLAPVTPSYAYPYEKAIIDFGKDISVDKTSLHDNAQGDIKAYGVVFTKELPANGTNNCFTVIYDKASKNGTEVQIARQDGTPSILVQLGKAKRFFKQGAGVNVYSWILYCSSPTRINILPNGEVTDPETILSFIIDLY